jgi:hypothetical protein
MSMGRVGVSPHRHTEGDQHDHEEPEAEEHGDEGRVGRKQEQVTRQQ